MKKNKLNPRCIKEKDISVIDQLQTEVPPKIKELESKGEKYINIAREIKNQILNNKLKAEFEEIFKKVDKGINELVEKVIEV